MWLFDITLETGNSISFALDDDKKSTQLFKDIQDWISSPDNKLTPKCICVKTADSRNVIIKTESIIAAEIESITDYQYQVKYGPV